MAPPPAKRARLSFSSHSSSTSEPKFRLALGGRSEVAHQPCDIEEYREEDELLDGKNEADMTWISTSGNGNHNRRIAASVPPSQHSRFFVNCDIASSDRIDNGFLTPQPTIPEKQSLKLVITSPSHLSTLKDNNVTLRSHNLSLAKQNRQLRHENARLVQSEKDGAQTSQVDVANSQTQLKEWKQQISELQDKKGRLQHENRLLNECGLEWARREAVMSSQNETLKKRIEQLMANRRTIVEQYQRMKAELDVARHVMAEVDAAAGLSWNGSAGQNAYGASGQEYPEL